MTGKGYKNYVLQLAQASSSQTPLDYELFLPVIKSLLYFVYSELSIFPSLPLKNLHAYKLTQYLFMILISGIDHGSSHKQLCARKCLAWLTTIFPCKNTS